MTILVQQNNVWTYARNEVMKPGIGDQLAHSSTFVKMNKTLTTKSGAISAVKDIAQNAAGFIPLPVVGSIVSALLGKLHGAARSAGLDKKLAQAQASDDPEGTMKYMLKTMDTATLRAHQAKTGKAFKIMMDGIDGHKQHMDYAVGQHAVCPEILKRAKQIQYTLKHLNRLEGEAAALMECARLLAEYTRQLTEFTEKQRDRYSTMWADSIPQTLDPAHFGEYEHNKYHANCLNNGYCVIKKSAGGTDQILPGPLKSGLKMLFTSSVTVSNIKTGASYI